MAPKPTKSEYIETDAGNKVSRRAHIHGTPHIILGGRTVLHAEACLRGDCVRASSSSTTSTSTSTSTNPPAPSSAKDAPKVAISVGRYTLLGSGSVLRPSLRTAAAAAAPTTTASLTATPTTTITTTTTATTTATAATTTTSQAPPVPSTSSSRSTFLPLKVGDGTLVAPDAVVHAASVGSGVEIGRGAVVGRMCVLKDGCRVLEGAVVPAGMVVPSGAVVAGRPARWVGDVAVGWEGVDGRAGWRAVR